MTNGNMVFKYQYMCMYISVTNNRVCCTIYHITMNFNELAFWMACKIAFLLWNCNLAKFCIQIRCSICSEQSQSVVLTSSAEFVKLHDCIQYCNP